MELPAPVSEDVARSAFALLIKLDAQGKHKSPTPLTVFRFYCVEGLSAELVADKCRCAKGTVMSRLRFIEEVTHTKPEHSRALSGHLQQMADDYDASGAREIYRRGLVDMVMLKNDQKMTGISATNACIDGRFFISGASKLTALPFTGGNTEKMKTTSQENFISKSKVAKRLNRSLKTVNNWMKRGILPYYKLGHRVSFRWSEVVAHLQENHLRTRRQIWGQAHFPITKNLSAFPPVDPVWRSTSAGSLTFPALF